MNVFLVDVDTTDQIKAKLKRIGAELVEKLELSKVKIFSRGGLVLFVMFNWNNQTCFKYILEKEIELALFDVADIIAEQVP